MLVFKSEMPCSIDVDDTLVLWKGDIYSPAENRIGVRDPYDKEIFKYLIPHIRHINFLKKLHARGYQITVWSHGGPLWAEAVVKALKLEQYVTKVEGKPIKIIDDLPASKGIGIPMYLPFNNNEEG